LGPWARTLEMAKKAIPRLLPGRMYLYPHQISILLKGPHPLSTGWPGMGPCGAWDVQIGVFADPNTRE